MSWRHDGRWVDEDERRDFKRENPSQVAFDEALRRARDQELDPDPIICAGCGNQIDPTVCGCGEYMLGHSVTGNHSPVAMGCACWRSTR